jgi:hypothetical protein
VIRLALALPANEADRGCADCAYLRGAVSWWCTNRAAVKARGTAIPGAYGCQHWKPAPPEGLTDAWNPDVIVVRSEADRKAHRYVLVGVAIVMALCGAVGFLAVVMGLS